MSTLLPTLQLFSTGSMTSSLGGFLEGERGDITYPIPIYVIEHQDALVVVDTGLHPDLAADTSRLGSLDGPFRVDLPADGSAMAGPQLRQAGFGPEEVDVVVMTHLHFDHAGGLLQFPNARLVIQGDEWTAGLRAGRESPGGFNADDFDLGHDRHELEGDLDLFGDGTVTCLLTDGHTAGHQSVRVRTEAGTFVICGDCCYLRRTLLDEHLPPFGADRSRQLESIRRLARQQSNGATLLFGHDPEQWGAIAEHGLHPGV